ncbi:ParB/RepB/Spo0J family partition protein [Bullifex sp.]|uniref:ParB/RepB/Spo0J family partition protein n=1 Tax=Bullifex sp. TaxID=2815808 RepID=UPI002A7F31DC|nr:ParB/RepB/Spo0J family partition protein [Bullifex sp.]MDD5972753.1 ParB/RepB/Spo0J family partition protein [Spirochaetales bacterium]MDY4068109.1 ParB/RepB/Spo0J family partition protein [Bullifex sp.]
MSAKKTHGLGKGMGSLLGNFDFDITPDVVAKPKEKITVSLSEEDVKDRIISVSIDKIKANENQPRKSFDDNTLEELAESIKNQGVLQPLLVEKINDDCYIIVAGERRFRAAKLAGLKEIPVIVRSFTEIERIEVALIENIQRENLNSIDEAAAYQYLIQKSGLTQEEVAVKVGKKRSTVANSLRLLQLPDSMKDDVISGVLSAGHARAILSLVNPNDRVLLRDKIIEKELSVREAEEEAELLNQGKKVKIKRTSKTKDPYVQEVEDKLLEAFGTKVEVKGNLKRGKLVIQYSSKADLERLYKILGKSDDLFE